MAVQAQFAGLLLQPYAAVEEQPMRALMDYGVAAVPAVAGGAYACVQQYGYCAAQSELMCNNGPGGAAMPAPSRKRGRDEDDDAVAELLHYAAFLPLPHPAEVRLPHSVSVTPAPAPSTSGRPAEAPAATDALASELWRRHGAEVDALVRAECDRLRAGLEAARKRQRQALFHAATERMRQAEVLLGAERRRAAELEERVRRAAAEAQAWCGVARGNEAVAKGLRATLDALLLRSCSAADAAEGFGESEPGDMESCCCEQAVADTAAATASSPAARWACRACGTGEASVLVLPCRHLCLCKACEPRLVACPVCAGAKNAAIHIAPN